MVATAVVVNDHVGWIGTEAPCLSSFSVCRDICISMVGALFTSFVIEQLDFESYLSGKAYIPWLLLL